jgi:outer membrane protein assembly factor BamB
MVQHLRNSGFRGALAIAMVSLACVTSFTALGDAAPSQTSASAPTYTWPKFAYSPSDTGVSLDPAISTANASRLGVRWMVPDQSADLSSPVVAYSESLGVTVVYQGNEDGYMTAFNAATGAILWSDDLGTSILDTPLVADGSVWVARTYDPIVYSLNAATGAIQCQMAPVPSFIFDTPTIGTPPGGTPTVFIGHESTGDDNGVVYALQASNCSVEWKFSSFNSPAGTWDPYSYAVDAQGVGLLLIGSDNPDTTVYALNAVTGKKVWTYTTQDAIGGHGDDDIGTGASVTAPGVNGFAGGALYVSNNAGYTYGLNLTTGKEYWRYNYGSVVGAPGRSTAAVLGDEVIFGEPQGVLCLNAVTGALKWEFTDAPSAATASEVFSAPAVVGPSGKEVVAVTDLSGAFDVLDAATGALLYSYQTGGYDITSVAESGNNFYVSSGSGFLFDFRVGGSNAGAPTASITSPASGSAVVNPDGAQTISGTAQGAPIVSVDVAIQSGGPSGPWWDAATGAWEAGFFVNPATLAHPGSSGTKWSLSLPVPTGGGEYSVTVSATAKNGQAYLEGYASTPSPARMSFTVDYLKSAPHLTAGDGGWVAPGTTIGITGSGFAANETVDVSLEGTTLTTVGAGSGGGFSTDVTIPSTSQFGPAALLASGETSGRSSSAPIDVSNQWASDSYDSLHQGYEPDDTTWSLRIVGNKSSFLTQAWSYPSGGTDPAGAGIGAPPAVVDNVAYFGNNAGTVTALDVQNSSPIWTYSAGSMVDSSPAVASGLVVFGTTARDVDALSQSTGKLVWQTPTSSGVSSAPTEAGALVYVGSDNGTLYALDTASGSVVWHRKLQGAISDSPAVDPITNEVVVGDTSGKVTALDSATGKILWTVATGGPVTANPTICQGDVYVGSGSGTVFGLNESTGVKEWTFPASSAVTAGGAIATSNGVGTYVVGDSNGNVYLLNLTSGTVERHFTGPSALTGISTADTWIAMSFSDGSVWANKFSNEFAWRYQAPAATSEPVLVDGVVYVASENSSLYAFTVPGTPIP